MQGPEAGEQRTAMTEFLPAPTGKRRYVPGLNDVGAGHSIRQRFFVSSDSRPLVAGIELDVQFVVARPPAEVWPIFQDFNAWHQPKNYYSGCVGGLEGKTFDLFNVGEEVGFHYHVLKVIPERLIVTLGPLPRSGHEYAGGISVFAMTGELETSVSCLLELAYVPSHGDVDRCLDELETFAPFVQAKWVEQFIPKLRAIVEAARA